MTWGGTSTSTPKIRAMLFLKDLNKLSHNSHTTLGNTAGNVTTSFLIYLRFKKSWTTEFLILNAGIKFFPSMYYKILLRSFCDLEIIEKTKLILAPNIKINQRFNFF